MAAIASASLAFLPNGGPTYNYRITYDSHSGTWGGSGYVEIGPYDANTVSSTVITDLQTAVKADVAAHGVSVGGGDWVRIINLFTG